MTWKSFLARLALAGWNSTVDQDYSGGRRNLTCTAERNRVGLVTTWEGAKVPKLTAVEINGKPTTLSELERLLACS